MTASTLRIFGWVGLAGAMLVGTGEFFIQFSPAGGYELPGYPYFAHIPFARITWAHFLSTLAAPLYLPGYVFLGHLMSRSDGLDTVGWTFALTGMYAFVVGNAWLGGRGLLAAVVQFSDPSSRADTLAAMASLNEPLVNVLRIAIVILSVIWVARTVSGRGHLPQWMAVFNPALLLAVVFALYAVAPVVGTWLLPTAMNVTHVTIFALCLRFHRPRAATAC